MSLRVLIKEYFKQFRNETQDVKISYQILETPDDKIYIFIRRIIVKKTKRNKGVGKLAMSKIIEFCRSNGISITLNVSNVYGSNLNRLVEFYGRLGFTKNYNKNFDGDYILSGF